jgi:NAD+ synthase (glutamine-hydrolysing)
MLRLVLAQLNVTVGDLPGNRDKIISYLDQSRQLEADIVAFPEMAITGYPPEDLLLKADFLQGAQRCLREIEKASHGLTVIVGTVHADTDLYNGAAVIHDAKLIDVYRKQYLPNYGVFDEDRYFSPGHQRMVFDRDGVVFGVSICEDIWYPDGPPEAQASEAGAELLINISSSPYHVGKGESRERMLATRAADNKAIVAYCNLVGGQDELVFDGRSLICDPQGEVIARAPQFTEALVVADLEPQQVFRARLLDPRRRKQSTSNGNSFQRIVLPGLKKSTTPAVRSDAAMIADPLPPAGEVYSALVLGTRDYVHKNGFQQVVLGLSGGIDSALTAAVAVDALGSENVTGVAMPTRYSSGHSLEDAEQLAANLGIRLIKVPIDDTFQSFLDTLAPVFDDLPQDITEENLQPRIRGTLLMALSNKFGWLVLTTGNKSEVGVGYSTLYGDTAGGFAVIKDVPKLLVYELSRYYNVVSKSDRIPQRVLEKPPSAELRPDQKDSDSLPDYGVLDPILQAYVEDSCSLEQIVSRGLDQEAARRITKLVDRNEYKRRQSPPGVKISSRAFGKDWRLPISNRYTGG